MAKTELLQIRNAVEKRIGQPIELTTKDRRKLSTHSGVIESAYPSLFTVRVGEERLCFTYADILTKSIVLRLLKCMPEEKTIG